MSSGSAGWECFGGCDVLIILTAYTTAVWYYMVWTFQRSQQLRVEMLSRAEYPSLRYHNDTRTGDAIYRIYQDSATPSHTAVLYLESFAGDRDIVVRGSRAHDVVALVRINLVCERGGNRGPDTQVDTDDTSKARLSRELNSDLTSRIQENLTAMRVIKANGAEQLMMSRFDHDSQGALEAAFQFRNICRCSCSASF